MEVCVFTSVEATSSETSVSGYFGTRDLRRQLILHTVPTDLLQGNQSVVIL